ncbi:MAG: MlaE family ABC transporter permease [Sphingobacteriaceae bacterium]|jgi:phospholipid/cholesterol/gamma-HCH transport system permease protein
MKPIFHLGRYFLLMVRVFSKPEKLSIYLRQTIYEINSLGTGSLGLIAIISVFMGGVITIQSAYNFTSPFIPLYAIGLGTRESIVLEFSPTIISLILAGKVGSNIASEIGTMRISEQIDALEIMGINSASYLILPKILGAMFINPFLIIISMFLGILGGYIMGVSTGACSSYEYIFGIQSFFIPFNVYYSLTKTVIFAFIITSVSAYHGYYTSGGALEVGQASTKSVVYNSILILITNLVITQVMLV